MTLRLVPKPAPMSPAERDAEITRLERMASTIGISDAETDRYMRLCRERQKEPKR
jgi:hypothetical protein